MADSPIEIIELNSFLPEADMLLRQVYDTVLRPSFSSDELPDFDVLFGGPADGARQLVVIALQDRAPVAVAVSDEPSPGSLVLLSYLAVRPGLRSRGIGSLLLSRMVDRWRDSGVDLALGEIHDPRFHVEGPNEHPMARLRFYHRHGAELLWAPWMQPALSPESYRVTGMLLIAFYRNESCSGPVLPAKPLAAWAQAYYEIAERSVPTDADYRALLARLDLPHGVEARSLAEFEELLPLQLV